MAVARVGAVVATVVLLTAVPIRPAGALVTAPGPCSGGYILDVPLYEDVTLANPHRADIACIAGWGITVNRGTFDPKGAVTRRQMALFLTRTYSTLWTLPDGSPQGFADIGALPPEQQVAVNQAKQLSLTAGVSPTSFDPDGVVTRGQMALFLTRLIHAAAVPLPTETDSAFADLAGVSAQARLAIEQLAELGIANGTSPTTFSPAQPVTREQMASFLTRTLSLVWYLEPFSEADEVQCRASGDCTGAGVYWADTPFATRASWVYDLPFPSPAEEASFASPETRAEILVDGAPVPVTRRVVTLAGRAVIDFEATFPSGLSGVHTLSYVFYDRGEVATRFDFSFDFSL